MIVAAFLTYTPRSAKRMGSASRLVPMLARQRSAGINVAQDDMNALLLFCPIFFISKY